MNEQQPIIVWFRQDLRLTDNAALHHACQTDAPIIFVFIHDPELAQKWTMGAAKQWWLHHSLSSLAGNLKHYRTDLILRRGATLEVLENLINETNAQGLYFSRHYEPYQATLENEINAHFKDRLTIKRFKNNLLVEPETVLNKSNEPFKVFTPFYKAAMATLQVADPLPAPNEIDAYTATIASDDLDAWQLLPDETLWGAEFKKNWVPGEQGAQINLDAFTMHALNKYNILRNRPEFIGTSRISPHLHFGEISPRQIWNDVIHSDKGSEPGNESYLKELMWREFSYYLLHYWPDLPDQSFKDSFADFPWQNDSELLNAWQHGKTGYPIVDAGMRELLQTGWMHNRVRMVVASFLIKHLLIDWRHGEAWFWDTLVDADLANNSASWQWVAGCGADAAPYFRIFNPQLQGEKFDPDGIYVKQWLPELQHLPNKFIHAPWGAPAPVLQEAGVELGKDYPQPIVEHHFARERALAAFETIKINPNASA